MATSSTSFWRDGNRVPITGNGLLSTKSITLVGNNNTYNIALFTVTGAVEIVALYGVVTTVIGANHTASAWRINDQAAQVYLTAVGGTDISTLAAGSVIFKKGLVATALSKIDNASGAILEPTTLETNMFSPVVVVKKTGALTQIEYHYATTDTPTSGVIEHFCGYLPLSEDGAVTPV